MRGYKPFVTRFIPIKVTQGTFTLTNANYSSLHLQKLNMLRLIPLRQHAVCFARGSYVPISRQFSIATPCLRNPSAFRKPVTKHPRSPATSAFLDLISKTPKRDLKWFERSRLLSRKIDVSYTLLRLYFFLDLKQKLHQFSSNPEVRRKSKNLGLKGKLYLDLSASFTKAALEGNLPRLSAKQLLDAFNEDNGHGKI